MTDPTPAAPTPDAAAPDLSEGWRRLHPLSPLLRGGLFVLVIAGIVLANLRDRLVAIVLVDVPWAEESGSNGDIIDVILERNLVLVAFLTVFGVLLFVVLFSWLGWRMHTYRITSESVESRSGILFRQHRRAPLDRIQGVNLQRPLLARLLGLTMLEVATAGQDGKVKLNYLGHRDAKAEREHILAEVAARRTGTRVAPSSQDPAVHAPAPAQAGAIAPAGESPLRDPALAAMPDQLANRVEDFADLDLDAGAGDSLVTVPAGRLLGATLLSWPTIIFGVGIAGIIIAGILGESVLLFMLVPAVITFFGVTFASFTRSMNFHLSLSEQGVRVSTGLLSTVTETIPRGRIHAIEVYQPLGWRPFGWWHVRITTAGLGPTSSGGNGVLLNIMLPVGRFVDAARVLDVLLPAHGMAADDLREAMTGSAGDFIGSPKRAAWILWFARRRNGLRVSAATSADAAHVQLRRGLATRRLVLVPMVRIQSVQLHRGLLHRPLGLAALTTHTVLGPVQTRISGLALADARAAFAQIVAAAVEAGWEDSQKSAATGAER